MTFWSSRCHHHTTTSTITPLYSSVWTQLQLYIVLVFCYQNSSDLPWEKNWSSDGEKLLFFEAEEFLRLLEQFIQTVKGRLEKLELE